MIPPKIDPVYLLGTFDPAKDSLFVRIQDQHSAGSGRGAFLHQEAYEAFVRMHDAAKADGISLIIKSATRNFYRQKAIWEAKWTGARRVGGKNLAQSVADPAERAKTILRYSSMPGTSRHHWGTDMDLNAFENDYFKSGRGLAEYEWLVAHAAEFGFGQPYTAKGPERPNGYEEERWHWSYLPVAKSYLAAYRADISPAMIKGFKGAEVAESLDVIQNYVFGIHPNCKDQ
ncbi:MAG: M15 family metallopeptidase [Bacteroidota bacterium]